MNDLRFALRQLVKNPGFTTVAVLTLALGIGANTAMFSALQAILLRALPYPEPERIVRVFRTSPQSQSWPHSPANFLDHRAQNHVFERMAALGWATFNLAEQDQPAEQLRGMLASGDFFPLLGTPPAFGRTFTATEDRPGFNSVVVLNHGFWLRRFAGDTNIVGRSLRLDGESVTVIGVMPAGFHDPMLWGPVDVWRPLAFTDEQRGSRGNNWLASIARLKPGVSLAQARAEMDGLAARLEKAYPANNSQIGLRLLPLAQSAMDETGRRIVWMTMGLAVFVLLIACANLANLQFARTVGQARELAIRGALGASRGRILRQLLTESLMLSVLGGGLGLLLADWGTELLGRQIVVGDETGVRLPLGSKALVFALLATGFSSLAFALLPAWLATRIHVNEVLKQGAHGATASRSQHRLRHGLIVAELAAALVLLAGAGIFIRGLDRFTFHDPGWRVDGLTIGYLSLPESKYRSAGSRLAFTERVQERLGAMPGVERMALGWSLPIFEFNSAGDFAIEGRPEPPQGHEPLRFLNAVTPGYFETLGISLAAGRGFTTADTTNRPAVVIINETMARTLWPGESPLGKRIGSRSQWEEIVGVVGDVRFAGNLGEPATRFQAYRPFAQEPRGYLAVALRGAVTAETLRRAVAELDSDQPVNEPGTAREAVRRMLVNYSLTGWLLGGFSLLGLLLAGLGIYGVIAGFVAQRTAEIGMRMALGAKWRDVLWLVLGKGLRLILLGTVLGLTGALVVARLLATAAPELPSDTLPVLSAVTLLLIGVALFACWIPARRAARIDPMKALRAE